jgi:hypothetical protein
VRDIIYSERKFFLPDFRKYIPVSRAGQTQRRGLQLLESSPKRSDGRLRPTSISSKIEQLSHSPPVKGENHMIVDRRTFVIKRGCMQEAIKVAKAERERSNSPRPTRIYAPCVGAFDLLVLEVEYESLGEYEKSFAEYFTDPEAIAFQEKLYELTEVGGGDEFWTLL